MDCINSTTFTPAATKFFTPELFANKLPVANKLPARKLLANMVLIGGLFSTHSYAAMSAGDLDLKIASPHVSTMTTMPANPSKTTSSPKDLSTALQLAHQQQLASQKAWLRLLYYPEVKGHAPFTSRINNRFNPVVNQQQFFASAAGASNPQAELDKMLSELYQPTLKDNDAVQCRFPARTQWLIDALNINRASLPAQHCGALHTWLQQINPQSVSLIFASEYLDSPASAFAHSFLRFDNSDVDNQYYLNFTPKVTEGEHFLKFAYKSSIGGNAGEFSMTNYQQGIKEYLQDDGRNVWQYQLNLTDAQVQQLAYRTWEIKDQILPYYLMADNCASEILVLLNSIFPNKNFLSNHSPMVSPAQVVRLLKNEHLIRLTDFSPATPTIAQAKINREKLAQNHQDLLNIPPSQSVQSPLSPSRDNPELANPLSRFDIGIAHQSFTTAGHQPNLSDNNAVILNYRMVYRDALDKIDGYPIGSQLSALTVGIRVNDNTKHQDAVQLQRLGIIDARSFHPVNTAKKGPSWGATIGLQREFDGINNDDPNYNHLVANFSGELGRSIAFGKTTANSGDMPANICYGLGSVAAQFGKGLYHGYRTGLGVNVGCNAELTHNWRAISELKLPFWFSGDSNNERYWQPKLSLGSQFDINQRNAIRATASREWLPKSENIKKVDEAALTWLHYFE